MVGTTGVIVRDINLCSVDFRRPNNWHTPWGSHLWVLSFSPAIPLHHLLPTCSSMNIHFPYQVAKVLNLLPALGWLTHIRCQCVVMSRILQKKVVFQALSHFFDFCGPWNRVISQPCHIWSTVVHIVSKGEEKSEIAGSQRTLCPFTENIKRVSYFGNQAWLYLPFKNNKFIPSRRTWPCWTVEPCARMPSLKEADQQGNLAAPSHY